jgi:hypothetical protein
MARVLSILLTFALLAPQGLLNPSPASAQAQGLVGGFMELTSVFFGEGGRTFGPGDVITVSGTIPYIAVCLGMFTAKPGQVTGRGEGPLDIFPVADLYVIADTGKPLAPGTKLQDVSGGVNRVTGLTGGLFVDEVVAIAQPAGNLGPGRYDIVMDQCLDGMYDSSTDIVLGDGPGYAFEVVIPGPVQPINYHPLKQAAGFYAALLQGQTINVPLPYASPIEVPGFCTQFGKMVDKANIDKNSAFGGWTAIGKQRCGDLIKHWDGIANDPPDPNFTQFAELGPLLYDFRPASAPVERLMREFAHALSEQAAASQALLTSIERFQGAQLAGNDEYAMLQLRHANHFINLLIGPGGSMLRACAILESLDLALNNDPLGLLQETTDWRATFPEYRHAIGGLLNALGPRMDRAVPPLSNGADLVPVGFQAWIGIYLESDPIVAAMPGLGGIPHDRTSRGLPPVVFSNPVAATSGPYSGPPATALNFDASKSSDPNGDPLTYAWDLDGDGQFNDAATANPSFAFAEPGTRLVGVKVSDPAGNTDVFYTQVQIGDVNNQDIIASPLSRELYRISRSGQVTTLRPGYGYNYGGLQSLHVDVNGDIWVLSTPQLEHFDSNGVLLNTITPAQVASASGVPLNYFTEFVLDGRGDILLTAMEDAGPGVKQVVLGGTVYGQSFNPHLDGRLKLFRVSKDANRASYLADLNQHYINRYVVNGTQYEDFDYRNGAGADAGMAIDPNGDVVIAGINATDTSRSPGGVWKFDPNTGAGTEVIPAGRSGATLVVTDPVYGTFFGTDLAFGGHSLGAGGMGGARTAGGLEIDPQGRYIAGNGNWIANLRLYSVATPPKLTNVPNPGLIAGFLQVEAFPLQMATPGSPVLNFTDFAVDSAGDYLVGGWDGSGQLPSGVFRVTPFGGVFPVAAVSGPFSPLTVLDVVPQLRKVTPKDVAPPPQFQLESFSVNQQACPGGVDLSVSVHNLGSADITDPVRVVFYDGDPEAGGMPINAAFTSGTIAAGGSTTVSATWPAPPVGNHSIFAMALGSKTIPSRGLLVCAPLPAAGQNAIQLTPLTASSNVGTNHTVTAAVLDIYANGIPGVPITFDVTGANTATGTGTTDVNGLATFTYTGNNSGQDTIVASFPNGGASNSVTQDWLGAPSDTTPPVLTVPATTTVEATSAAGAVVNYSASANDAVDGPITPTCAPASGSAFPLGKTTVNCSATDLGGNTASASFDVFVVDTTPPMLAPHANLSVPATSASGAAVNYAVPAAADLVDANPKVACAPSSGSLFPMGATTVNCTATDFSGNAAQSSFSVSVQVGTPRIAGTLVGRGSDAAGNRYFDVTLTNTGTGHARNLKISQLPLRTLAGSGSVTYLPTLSGALPLSIGSLDVGASSTVRLFLGVPSTVTRFSITETGTVNNVLGTMYSFSTAQSVIP